MNGYTYVDALRWSAHDSPSRRREQRWILELARKNKSPISFEPGDEWDRNTLPITGPAPAGFKLIHAYGLGYESVGSVPTPGHYYGQDAAGNLYVFEPEPPKPRPAPRPVREAHLILPDDTVTPLLPLNGKKFGVEDLHAAGLNIFERLALKGAELWCHEEGKVFGLPYNLIATMLVELDGQWQDWIAGPAVVIWTKGAKLRRHPKVIVPFGSPK